MEQLQIRVLLVEDNPEDARLVERMLHHAANGRFAATPIKLIQAACVQTAQQILETQPVDLILLNLPLSDASKLEAFHKLNQTFQTAPIIILSSHTNQETAFQAVQQGAQDYLDKQSLTPHGLLKAVYLARERHQHLLAAKSQLTELESQNSALSNFSHTVAHQIQGLLSQMVGYASVVDTHYKDQLDQSAQMAVDKIMQSGYKMNNVITELLFLATMRSDTIQVRELNNKRILVEVTKRLRYQIRETKAKITMPDSWPAAFGYTPWIEEVWLNYMSNGLKYGGDEFNPPQLKLGAQRENNGMVRFWVADNGPGISAMDQKRLFKPHTRLTTRKIQGEGLGLSIVWQIVKKCGGNVGVESQEGAGSCFWFTLPEAS